ncbi:MAG TPA: KGG domain-containing protein [Gemmatimonadaceae bacterium]|nr:KGG domain-containing protein [Gemmatimonadaceae bacterium]
MANRSGNDDRSNGTSDRERQRDVISEPTRGSSMSASANAGSANGASSRKSARGFASMDTGKQREIASKGGRAAHAKGTAHEFDSNEARAAGRKGGMAVSRNREHMAAIGRRGGEARGQRAREAASNGAAFRSAPDASRQNTTGGTSNVGNTRGVGGEREVGISGTSLGATQNSRGGENALGGERRQQSPSAGGVEGTRGEDRA